MDAKKKEKVQKSNAVSWAVFLISVEITFISLIPIIFPALITRTISPISISPVDKFELGFWAIPLILTSIIILGISILYLKNKLPSPITKSFKFIYNFEVSKKVSILVILVLLSIYIAGTVEELKVEESYGDYTAVKEQVLSWNVDEIFKGFDFHLRFFLLGSSLNLFENIRVIPFIASISLLILTYLITLEMSKKRFSGLVAMTILLQSPIFLKYDTTATYENFWTLFYLLSLYLIYKSGPISPILYVLSIFSKPITAIFFPMTFFFIYRANILRKKKIRVALLYSVIIIGAAIAVVGFNINIATTDVEFVERFFWDGYVSMSFQIRSDVLVILFILPVVIGLFVASRKGILQAESVLVLIVGMLFSAPMVTGFTDITNQPYRFIPLVVFFAMGVGMLLSKRENQITPRS